MVIRVPVTAHMVACIGEGSPENYQQYHWHCKYTGWAEHSAFVSTDKYQRVAIATSPLSCIKFNLK